MGLLATPAIRRIAVVGAGPGGVAAAKYLRAEQCFEQIDVYEQQNSFGGAWNFSSSIENSSCFIPQTNPNLPLDKSVLPSVESAVDSENGSSVFITPMYEGLETNIPHVLMKYSDGPSLEAHQLFPKRETLLDYLAEYANDIKELVQFNTQVNDIQWRREDSKGGWTVEIKRLDSDKTRTLAYDAVVVANGHYNVPYLPDIKGIKEWNQVYPGIISHSKFYRKPTDYADKKVVVVGNSASGADIANQISKISQHPILNSTRSDSPLSFDAPWKKTVPEIAEFLLQSSSDRAIRFKDGSTEANVDAILFCTGYYYSFPFLSRLHPKLIDTGERVLHLFRHLFYIDHPSLAFIGLPSKIIPFRTFEGQAAVAARVWAERLSLPSKIEMNQWEEREVVERGSGKPFHVLPFPKDFDYHNDMVNWALKAQDHESGKLPPKWSHKETWQRERFPLIKKAFGELGECRRQVKTVEDLGFDYDEEQRREKVKEDR